MGADALEKEKPLFPTLVTPHFLCAHLPQHNCPRPPLRSTARRELRALWLNAIRSSPLFRLGNFIAALEARGSKGKRYYFDAFV